MRRAAARAFAGLQLALATCLALGAAASCGSRTGLGDLGIAASEGGPDRILEPDVREELPGIDAVLPDVPVINPCPDAAATLIYVIGLQNTLYSFDPGAGTFTLLGPIACPGSLGSQPFSMAVDRLGSAYVIFSQNSIEATALYRVSTKTAECTKTRYNAAANGRLTFGMGFVANLDDVDAGDELFLALDLGHGSLDTNGELASLDTTTFEEKRIALFNPPVDSAELTGTGDGRLFAFSPSTRAGESFIAQIEPETANVIAKDMLPDVVQGAGWAFGFWGGAFYTFTTPGPHDPTTVVSRFDPISKTLTQVAPGPVGDTIVGAGVSTCAPQTP
jgi:hypothetical protein